MKKQNVNPCAAAQLKAAAELSREAGAMSFAPPVEAVYNPLDYAWDAFAAYVERFGGGPKRVVFLGMNPGPWGMAQTGVPFGEVRAVREWLKLEVPAGRPQKEHPAYPVRGLDCPRSEVSGRRLWGLFAMRFGVAEAFFEEHFVVNYCPLLFIAGRNLTPDRLAKGEREALYTVCSRHLQAVAGALKPEWIVGIGAFAEARAREALNGTGVKIIRILHPSPASPKSNGDWAGIAAHQLIEAGVWK
ncbi:MAG: hypothetical protein K5841_07645 [Fretibacterium sp.]|nr:hypothetical protein [Fretibacterium sp.]